MNLKHIKEEFGCAIIEPHYPFIIFMIKKLTLGTACFLFALALFGFTSPAEATTTPGCEISFTQNLRLGSSGTQVSALQRFLVAKGFLTIPAGVNTGYFGGLTKAAVARYQASVGILNSGYFGPLTRARVVADCGNVSTTNTFSLVGPNSGTYVPGSQLTVSYTVQQSSTFARPVLSLELENIYYPEQSIILSSNLPTAFNSGNPSFTQTVNIPSNAPLGTYRLVLCSGCLDNTSAGSVREIRSTGYITISNTAPVKSITVTSPTAGQNYPANNWIRVNWTAQNIPSDKVVRVHLVRADAPDVYIKNITQGYCNLPGGCIAVSTYGYVDYQIPSNMPAGDYKVVVLCWDRNSESSDCSSTKGHSGTFTISNPSNTQLPTLTVTSPTANQTYTQGSPLTVQWSNSAVTSSIINLSLRKTSDSGYFVRIGSLGQVNDGTETWTIPTTVAPGTDYFVRVNLDVTNPHTGMDVTRDSGTFSITATSVANRSIGVVLNTAAVSKPSNQEYNLGFNWTSTYPISQLWAQILDANGNVISAKGGQNATATNTDSWNVTIGSSVANGTYRLKLCEYTTPESARVCAPLQSFTVTNTGATSGSPTLTVVSPNTGGSVRIGEPLTVQWSLSNAPAGSYLNLFLQGPSSHRLLSSRVSGLTTNSQTFTIPVQTLNATGLQPVLPGSYKINAVLTDGALCITVLCPTVVVNTLASDMSDAFFTVNAAAISTPNFSITSISPTSGPAGTRVTLRSGGITASGNTIKFGNLDSSTTPGFNVNAVVYPRTIPMLTFNVPTSVAPGVYKVSIVNAGGFSNEVTFTVPHSIKLNNLNNGASIARGSTQTLQLTIPSDKVYSVSYHLIPRNNAARLTSGTGSFYDPVVGGYAIGAFTPTSASGSLSPSVTIPTDIPVGLYKLKVFLRNSGDTAGSPTDATTLANDMSDISFNITQ